MLRNDFARYNLTDDESDDLDQDNYGWKIISTDVFRFPAYKSLLCAIIGQSNHTMTNTELTCIQATGVNF